MVRDRECRRIVGLAVASVFLVLAGCSGGDSAPDDTGSDAGADTTNQAPIVQVDAPLQVQVGETIEFDASASTDPEGDELGFEWQLGSKPQGSSASLEMPSSPKARLQADAPGVYEVEVAVSDGTTSTRKTAEVSAINRAPTAEADANSRVIVGESVQLDGSGSSDPDGDSLSYEWSLVQKPSESSASIQQADSANAQLTPDAAGPYAVQLKVSDGSRSDTDRLSVTATSDEPGSIIYARESGDDSNPGTKAEPVKTLEKAVSLAKSHSRVDEIDLGPSTFDATPELGVDSRLTLTGAGTDATTLDAAGATGLTVREDVSAFDLTIEGGDPAVRVRFGARFDATSWRCEAAKTCIDARTGAYTDGGEVALDDSKLVGTDTGAGIEVNDLPLTARNVTIRDFGECISNGGAEMLLSESTLAGCEKGLRRYSDNSASVRVTNSTFAGNIQGVVVDDSDDVQVSGSTFKGHAKHAVRLKAGSSVVLKQSTIKTSRWSGIRAGDTSTLQLDGGEILDNGRGNPVDPMDRAGLLLEDETVLRGNTGGTEIANHPKHAVVVRGDATGTFENLYVHDAADAGLWADTTGKIVVRNGRYNDNQYGIRCKGSTNLEVDGATAGGNARTGIRFQSTGALKVRAATLARNEHYQVRVDRRASILDLGTDADGGGNLFINESQWKFAIYDNRPQLSSATGDLLQAAGNVYRSGNFGLTFDQSSLDGTTVTGPATYDNSSAGDANAVYKIEHENQRISF